MTAAFDIETAQLKVEESEDAMTPKADSKVKGVVWGFAGIALGGLCACVAIFLDMRAGGISPAQAGTTLGLLDAVCVLICAALGAYSRRKT